jgi:hypothetical protein
MVFLGLLGFGAATAQAGTTLAPDALAGIQAALGARDHAVADVSGSDIKQASQTALNTIVAEGVRALRTNGDGGLARKYEGEWEQKFSTEFTSGIDALDLGDHKPLSQWLANFYDKLEERLGRTVIRQGLLGDIYLMNFAIPITFAPKGTWRTAETPNRDWVEYRKHFIPFANVVTYWAVNIACNKIMKGQDMGKQGQKLCSKVAEKLRFVMGRRIAPKISDFIFNKANGAPASLDLTPADYVYQNAEDLAREIEAEGGVL